MPDDNERFKLAAELSRRMQIKRLRRIGEPVPDEQLPFERLPPDDQQNWLDLADVIIERDSDPPPTLVLRRLADDYDRYTRVLSHDPGWRDEMLRAVIVEFHAELARLGRQCDLRR